MFDNIPLNSPVNQSIDKINNVELTNPSNGQILVYDGSNWVNNYDIKMSSSDCNLNILNTGSKSIHIGQVYLPQSNTNSCVSVGNQAGHTNLGFNSVAIGYSSGNLNRGCNSTSVGYLAGSLNDTQKIFSTAIGNQAGFCNQGNYSTAVGFLSGYNNQHNNTTIINATGSQLNSYGTDRLYIKPIGNINKGQGAINCLYWNPTTGEISYSAN